MNPSCYVCRCNWIGRVTVLAFVSNTSARQQGCNGALAATRFWGGRMSGGCETTDFRV